MKLTRYGLVSALKCMKLYNESGLSGLRDRRVENRGAPRLLDEDQTQVLIGSIKEGYREGNFGVAQLFKSGSRITFSSIFTRVERMNI